MDAIMLLIITLLVILQTEVSLGFLMYPPNATNLGLVASVSVPVSEYFPERRILFDWCLTMGYSLPSTPAEFYSAPIWPGIPGTRTRRHNLDYYSLANTTQRNIDYGKYENRALENKRHQSDFTAGELYEGIEDFLVSYGFHATCLLRTVCELARHPFDDQHRSAITEVVTFFLTPSLHEGFDESEALYRDVYEEAENQGFSGADCGSLYPHCVQDFSTIISKVVLS